MKLFSSSTSTNLAKKISHLLNLSLSSVDTHVFPDGERRVRISENVLGNHAFLVASTNSPVDENYMELFFLIDGLKRSGAEFVTAIIPYLGYQRQDHVFREGEAVSIQVIIKILEALGIDRFISIDMHTPRIADLFSLPVTHLSALPLFAEEIRVILEGGPQERPIGSPKIEEGSIAPSGRSRMTNSILVSPDMGGIARIKKLAELLGGMPYVALEKNRDLETGSLSGDAVREGRIDGEKIAFIVDDMISSGKTIDLAAKALKRIGIEKIYVYATHGVFSDTAPQLLQESPVELVCVTDTVAIAKEKHFEKLEIISVGDIIAKEIQQLATSK